MQKSIGRKKSYRNTSWNFWKINPSSELQESVKPSSLKNSSDLVSLIYAGYYFRCASVFFSIQAYVSWICLYSVSFWSYWSRTNPSMTCVAGAWKGRERVFFGAPSRFFRAQNPLSLPFQTPLTQANLSMLAYFDEGVVVGLCMGGGR